MPIDTTIRPGDIITSDLMNSIIITLNRLEEEVDELGGLNRVRIESIQPGGRVGTIVQMTGANFRSPPADNIISIAGELVDEYFPPGNSAELTFRIPRNITITDPQGDVVEVRIDAGEFGRTSASYLLLPASGEADVDIRTLTDVRTGSTTLNTEQDAVVSGNDLGTDANDISIVFEHGGTTHAVTNIVDVAANGQQVRFTVPPIDTIDPPDPAPNIGVATFVYTRGTTEARRGSTSVRRLA